MAIFHSYVSHSQRVTTTKSRPSPKASVTSRVARVLGRKWAPPGSESGATRNWNSYNFYGFKASSLILTVFMAIRQTISPMWFTLFFFAFVLTSLRLFPHDLHNLQQHNCLGQLRSDIPGRTPIN